MKWAFVVNRQRFKQNETSWGDGNRVFCNCLPLFYNVYQSPKNFISFVLFSLLFAKLDLFLMWSKFAEAQQGTMNHTTATLSEARWFLAATSSGELVFFGGGYNATGPSDRVDICNVTSGIWTTATLSVARYQHAAASSGTLVFFAGGWIYQSTIYNTVDIYNTSDGTWNTATLSSARFALAATSVGNLVFFAGGYNYNGPSKAIDIYDMTRNLWTTTTLSQPRFALAATSVANRYALFAGGLINNTFALSVVDMFDLTMGSWSTAMLSQSRGYLAAASLANAAFFGGGWTGSVSTNVVDIFYAQYQGWRTASLTQPRSWLAAASVGDIIAFGGGTPLLFQPPLAVVDMYNATSNVWFWNTLYQSLSYLAAASAVNKIFFAGGANSSGLSNTVEIFEIVSLSQSPLATTVPSAVSTQTSNFTSMSITASISTSSLANATNSTSTQVIIGVSLGVGALVLVAAAVILLVVLLRKKRNKSFRNSPSESDKQQQQDDNYIPMGIIGGSQSSLRNSVISFDELIIEKEIGVGSYGKVCLGRWNNSRVALKFCNEKNTKYEFLREAKIMIELPPHPNIVQVFGVSISGPQPIIILEYCPKGSLDVLLYRYKNQRISDEKKIELVRGIASGMFHLHKHNIVHRDLAARNILLSANDEPKISDFGMSRVLQKTNDGKTQSTVGPICWMAPESIETGNYSKKSDVWTFAIVVYEIVARCEPHQNMDLIRVAIEIRQNGLTPKIPYQCPQKLRTLMEMCWKKDPNERPTFEAICKLFEER
jgi:hypothetical protein